MSNLSAEDVAQARRDLEQSLHGVSPLPKGGIAYDPTTAHIAVAWCIRYGDALLQLAEAVNAAPVVFWNYADPKAMAKLDLALDAAGYYKNQRVRLVPDGVEADK